VPVTGAVPATGASTPYQPVTNRRKDVRHSCYRPI